MFRSMRLPLLAVGLVAALAACSSAGPAASVATLEDPGASQPAASSAPTDPQEAFLAYAQCMRDEGIDMPDPEIVQDSSGEGTVSGGIRVEINGTGPDKEEFRAAEATCKKHLANIVGGPTSRGLSPEDEEKLLAYARCMREHGIDMPDPQDGGMIINEAGDDGPNLDPNDPEYQAAQEACGDLMPGKLEINGGPTTGGKSVDGGGGVVTAPDEAKP
jgi:hypothetical protein